MLSHVNNHIFDTLKVQLQNSANVTVTSFAWLFRLEEKTSVAAQKIISNMALAVQGQVQVVPDDGRGVYVGGLPKHAEWQELKDHMK